MTQGFDEWFKSEDPFLGNDENMDCIWAKRFMKVAFEAGAASRQAEVDGLKERKEFRDLSQDLAIKNIKDGYEKKIASLAKTITKMDLEIDELQKRIDEALKVFKSDLSPIGKFEAIHNILKGKEND